MASRIYCLKNDFFVGYKSVIVGCRGEINMLQSLHVMAGKVSFVMLKWNDRAIAKVSLALSKSSGLQLSVE